MTAREVEPLIEPPDATVVVPGSKSITNRALVLAALADGRSVLRGAGFSDDSAAMAENLARLGVVVRADAGAATFVVDGGGGRIDPGPRELDVGLSGTTARFLAPVAALGRGRYHLDGGEPMRRRPMGPTFDGLRALGASVEEHGQPGRLPATVVTDGLRGGTARVPGHLSSQFPSGLLLVGPRLDGGLRVELTSPLVSRPYLDITGAVLADFGAHLERPTEDVFVVAGTGLTAGEVHVEPDASAASYFFAAAAICAGRVRVEGLGRRSVQGDLGFVDILEAMGAEVRREDDATEVVGGGPLEGGEFDLADQPDMALTLAVTAVFASSATRVSGVGFIRGHETDRITAVVTELRRCGIEAEEEPDGFVVHPGRPRPATVETYDDHRMAMSFALLGLRAPGIAIADPGCVAKTFPGYFEALDGLRRTGTLSDP